MISFAPTAKLFGFQQRCVCSSFRKRLGVKLQFSSVPESKVLSSLDEECSDFLPWLEQISGAKISNVLSIGRSTYGRSLFASKVILAGDCLLKVPYNAQITQDELPPCVKGSLIDEVGSIGKLAAVIIIEKRKGQNSRWAPYITRLPQPEDMHSTIFWSEDELGMIHCSTIHKETAKQKAQIEKEFSAVAHALQRHLPEVHESITLKDFMHAYALVGSRAWETSKGISLIPFADFMNHDGFSESIVVDDEDEQLSEVTADRNYNPGEEVFISYGRFSNATLSLDFGFTLPYNIHDQVQVKMEVENRDPLREMKLELLQRHRTPSVKNIFHSSWDAFTIKEVKSAKGKGKGLPQSLRAFARILCLTSPQELSDLSKEAAQKDGRLARLPLNDSGKEFQAHQLLSSHISKLIEEHTSSIEVNIEGSGLIENLTI
ncbi:PREDICTED: histone-lysine N-methyltransferase setd3 isoform X2 [Tarenaya hassleriana]|uniref:histone-lysine N-methyltransferase setd3 isoform X2 n=1 Tax=Tarenaya hassleriana TaxID=28532 RepID=UPI00053C8852|nr:PREDICTED: histone-lysine N-methyltransferase setd3 isoform X2 [Tarenaya hassleriana]